jgi:hypothetical protein
MKLKQQGHKNIPFLRILNSNKFLEQNFDFKLQPRVGEKEENHNFVQQILLNKTNSLIELLFSIFGVKKDNYVLRNFEF